MLTGQSDGGILPSQVTLVCVELTKLNQRSDTGHQVICFGHFCAIFREVPVLVFHWVVGCLG